jgi:tRNA(fMet)-specific endonuclease VapC
MLRNIRERRCAIRGKINEIPSGYERVRTDVAAFSRAGTKRFFAMAAPDMALSIITKAELMVGPYRKAAVPGELAKVKAFVEKLTVLPFDDACADEFSRIAAYLFDQGKASSGLDVQIAATAKRHGLTVVTHNTRHFENIPGLQLEDWQR